MKTNSFIETYSTIAPKSPSNSENVQNEEYRAGALSLMRELYIVNVEAMEQGRNPLGYWIGPTPDEEDSGQMPVFVFSQPVVKTKQSDPYELDNTTYESELETIV